jgi:ribosomal-protein-alanine N-acetyltransferase
VIPEVIPEVIATERLTLPVWTPEEAADIRAGRRRDGWHRDYPRTDDRDAATLYRPGDPWAPRHVVRGVTALGSIGFFGPPEPAADGVPETEVGYGLVEEARGWGFATEALRGVLAETDRAGVRIRASVAPDNTASVRVLAKCGFTELRGANEDGELVMARPLPQPPGAGS